MKNEGTCSKRWRQMFISTLVTLLCLVAFDALIFRPAYEETTGRQATVLVTWWDSLFKRRVAIPGLQTGILREIAPLFVMCVGLIPLFLKLVTRKLPKPWSISYLTGFKITLLPCLSFLILICVIGTPVLRNNIPTPMPQDFHGNNESTYWGQHIISREHLFEELDKTGKDLDKAIRILEAELMSHDLQVVTLRNETGKPKLAFLFHRNATKASRRCPFWSGEKPRDLCAAGIFTMGERRFYPLEDLPIVFQAFQKVKTEWAKNPSVANALRLLPQGSDYCYIYRP